MEIPKIAKEQFKRPVFHKRPNNVALISNDLVTISRCCSNKKKANMSSFFKFSICLNLETITIIKKTSCKAQNIFKGTSFYCRGLSDLKVS